MKHTSRIATLSVLLALVCAPLAQAARGIQTDTQWTNCPYATCAFWSDDNYSVAAATLKNMNLGPLATDPLLDPSDPASFGSWDLLYRVTDDFIAWKTTLGDPYTDGSAQFAYYYYPDQQRWTVQFNYSFNFNLSDAFFFPEEAAFQWGDTLYTTTRAELESHVGSTEFNDFTFVNGALLAPSWWTTGSTTSTGVPEPGTLALLIIGGLGLGLAPRRRFSTLVQSAL